MTDTIERDIYHKLNIAEIQRLERGLTRKQRRDNHKSRRALRQARRAMNSDKG